MKFSKGFIRLQWAILVSLYLVIIAGSFVRITGSGMGCPDWPKCFGSWVPPTEAKELPPNYLSIFLEKRSKKVKKFCKFLDDIGMHETAQKLKNDPSIYDEENFNFAKTYTEYINRLVGFLAGNLMLFALIWALIKFRHRWLILLSLANITLMGIEGWFGSIVVATNLVPWTITVHMLLALIIVMLQIYILYRISPKLNVKIELPKMEIWIWRGIFAITFYQMFLGTQVREHIDGLQKSGIERSQWDEYFGLEFLLHRSFSWLVLVFVFFISWKNEHHLKHSLIRGVFTVLCIELIGGVLLSYFDMPGLVQTSHLLFACILFGLLSIGMYRFKSPK